jgi:type III pantothenate kinase
MILVDIGNSGLRACHSNCDRPVDYDRAKIYGPVVKLSWSSIGQQIDKYRPDPTESEHRRWVQIGDDEGYDWLVRQVTGQDHRHDAGVWRIASVNRIALERLLRAIDKHSKQSNSKTPIDYHVIDYRNVGIDVQVDYPEKVGIDRLLAARAALASAPSRPVIVVQAGTALTVDWVDHQGRFQGGSILPGAGLALQYLAAGTDQLPWLPADSIDGLPRLPGKNTEEAIAAGVHASVVISGGDGRLVHGHIGPPATYVENLVLVGLALCDPP